MQKPLKPAVRTPTTTQKRKVQLCLSANPYHPFSRYGLSLSCNTVVLHIPGNFNNRKDVTPPLVYSRSLLNYELKVFLTQQIYLLLSECAIDGKPWSGTESRSHMTRAWRAIQILTPFAITSGILLLGWVDAMTVDAVGPVKCIRYYYNFPVLLIYERRKE